MFSISEGEGRTFWAGTNGSSTYYVGQLVAWTQASKAAVTGGAVVPLAVPAGVADTTNFQVIAGIVVGFNNRTPSYATVGSLSLEAATGVTTQAAQLARDFTGAEGMYVKGDPQLMVQVAEITPNTVLKGPLYKSTYGAALTVQTASAGDTTGGTSAVTLTTSGLTGVANKCTLYCRSGANAGLYRVTSDTSATAKTVTVAFPYDIAAGDTFVSAPIKQGYSDMYIGGPGLFIDGVLTATDNFATIVYKLDLSTAGREYAEFRFAATHFDGIRA